MVEVLLDYIPTKDSSMNRALVKPIVIVRCKICDADVCVSTTSTTQRQINFFMEYLKTVHPATRL